MLQNANRFTLAGISCKAQRLVDRLGVLDLHTVLQKRGRKERVAQMGWEQRGAYSYYYKKERQGLRVKSIYVGRGQIADMIAEIQSSSPLLERLARTIKSPEVIKAEKAEATLQQVSDLTQLITQAALLTAGFHTHHRQWRRKRSFIDTNRNRKA